MAENEAKPELHDEDILSRWAAANADSGPLDGWFLSLAEAAALRLQGAAFCGLRNRYDKRRAAVGCLRYDPTGGWATVAEVNRSLRTSTLYASSWRCRTCRRLFTLRHRLGEREARWTEANERLWPTADQHLREVGA